ncbi:MAG: hypothetical protein ACJAQ3_001977, partial [Planctomycetota bacterium]
VLRAATGREKGEGEKQADGGALHGMDQWLKGEAWWPRLS